MSSITSTGVVEDDWTIVQGLISTYMTARNDLASLALMSFDSTGHFEMAATAETPQWVKDAFAHAQITEQTRFTTEKAEKAEENQS